MAQFNKQVVMTVTSDDRKSLSASNYILSQIKEKMIQENAEYLENLYIVETIDIEDIEQALWVIRHLIDAQEEGGWRLV